MRPVDGESHANEFLSEQFGAQLGRGYEGRGEVRKGARADELKEKLARAEQRERRRRERRRRRDWSVAELIAWLLCC